MMNIQLDEFLNAFFATDETVCLRIFDDRKSGDFKGMKLECEMSRILSVVDTLKDHNSQNHGIYFVINYGGHEDSDITRINAQFVECDDLPIDDQMKQIEAFPLPPSIIVKTRKSLHCYWLMNDAVLDDFRRIQKKLISRFNGDKVCINESRVFRLPGFYHCKSEPVMVECIKFDPDLRYTQAELESVLPETNDNITVNKTLSPKQKGLSLVLKRCLFIQYCHDNAAELSEHDWYAMITNLAVFEDGDRLIHALSESYPSYSHDETQDKINHFIESETKPITCAVIADKGFVCPKLRDGSCECKSPAALCYKPLDVNELRDELDSCEVKRDIVDNLQTAKDFTIEYLYNTDSVTAESFINYEMKSYFGFKQSDIKPLISLHRGLYKKFLTAKRNNERKALIVTADNLPPWYEYTERGLVKHIPGIQANYMAENIKTFLSAGVFYVYEDGVYSRKTDLTAQSMTRDLMIPKYTTMNAINDTVNQWKTLIEKPVDELNSKPYIINVRNGLLNVMNGMMYEHTPEYHSTVQINANYDPTAECPNFIKFLYSVLPETEIPLIQEILGYLLIPLNKAQKSFVFVGAPNAGKSTLLSVAQDILLGADNVSNVPWQNLGDRFNKALLFGKLANIFADLPSKAIDDVGMFKSLTGEDYISAEHKNRDPFNFRPYARFLFSCNEVPRNYGDKSGAFYRRLLIIRFDRAVPESERNPNLLDLFKEEADGIFAWSILGLRRLIDRNFRFVDTERTLSEIQRYKIECSSALSFLDEYCVPLENERTVRNDLYSYYKNYCMDNGNKPMSQIAFNKEVESAYPDAKRDTDYMAKRRIWVGIKYIEGGVSE